MFKKLKRRIKYRTALKPFAYRVVGKDMYTTQMENYPRAKFEKRMINLFYKDQNAKIVREKPDKFQQWKRKTFKRTTSIVESFLQ